MHTWGARGGGGRRWSEPGGASRASEEKGEGGGGGRCPNWRVPAFDGACKGAVIASHMHSGAEESPARREEEKREGGEGRMHAPPRDLHGIFRPPRRAGDRHRQYTRPVRTASFVSGSPDGPWRAPYAYPTGPLVLMHWWGADSELPSREWLAFGLPDPCTGAGARPPTRPPQRIPKSQLSPASNRVIARRCLKCAGGEAEVEHVSRQVDLDKICSRPGAAAPPR